MKADVLAVEVSPFVRGIREAIVAHSPFTGKLRVSVADEPRWEDSSSGDQVLVRWACWNLEENGVDLTAPVFEVLGKDVTREQLAAELPMLFPGVQIEVDNDIDV
jgi:hypothetical protein